MNECVKAVLCTLWQLMIGFIITRFLEYDSVNAYHVDVWHDVYGLEL